MTARYRSRLSVPEQAQVWKRWRAGETIHCLSQALGHDYLRPSRLIAAHGGVAPVERRRAAHALTLADREEISRGLCCKDSLRQIAKRLGVACSTVSREVRRNGGIHTYRAAQAEAAAWRRAERPKRCLLARHPQLCRQVAAGLRKNWSPQQISRRLEDQFANDDSMRVSHETIYRSLFIQARGVLKKELMQHLRRGRSRRQAKRASMLAPAPGRIAEGLSIRERPAEVQDRAIPGHWEGDLISGRHNGSHVATLVERHTRFLMLVKIPSKHAPEVAQALAKKMLTLPVELRRSLTWDRGTEMSDHKQFTLASDMQVYFCDPHSPWQRGSNENTNGLVRQYLPKGTDLSIHSQARLNAIARELNGRPRETLNFRTPAEKLAELLH